MYIFPNWEMLAKLSLSHKWISTLHFTLVLVLGTWYLVSSIVYPHLHILLSMV